LVSQPSKIFWIRAKSSFLSSSSADEAAGQLKGDFQNGAGRSNQTSRGQISDRREAVAAYGKIDVYLPRWQCNSAPSEMIDEDFLTTSSIPI
jgi:hypothetical protein